MSETIKTPLEWLALYIADCEVYVSMVPSTEGFITFLEDNHKISFDDAISIAEDKEVARRIDLRAIAKLYKMLSLSKGRNSRDLMGMIDAIKSKGTVDTDNITIIIEETDKEV